MLTKKLILMEGEIMLRSKGLSEKVLMLGNDGLDPKFSRKMVDGGHMPNLKK